MDLNLDDDTSLILFQANRVHVVIWSTVKFNVACRGGQKKPNRTELN